MGFCIGLLIDLASCVLSYFFFGHWPAVKGYLWGAVPGYLVFLFGMAYLSEGEDGWQGLALRGLILGGNCLLTYVFLPTFHFAAQQAAENLARGREICQISKVACNEPAINELKNQISVFHSTGSTLGLSPYAWIFITVIIATLIKMSVIFCRGNARKTE